MITDFHSIDWSRWEPVERATLVFVVDRNRILLIHKKRGLGAGKINAPGGRIEPGEDPMDGAARELREEVRIDPLDLRPAGELAFQFADGHAIHAKVFRSGRYTGAPEETDEAAPFWVEASSIPYDRMWADDRLWVPHLLAGRYFRGRFLFDGDRMLGHELAVEPGREPPSGVA